MLILLVEYSSLQLQKFSEKKQIVTLFKYDWAMQYTVNLIGVYIPEKILKR